MENQNWVYDGDEIAHVNETSECICGNADLSHGGRWHPYRCCMNCDRWYASDGNIDDWHVFDPRARLATDEVGVVDATPENETTLALLTEMNKDVQEYLEFFPTGYCDDVALYAYDGLYLGYLAYNGDNLVALAIADGYHGDGHGTRFVEEWFAERDEDVLSVMAYDYAHPFYEQLDIEVDL